MNNLCKHCEYGNRFIDLGQCPECNTGRIVGDLHTRNIFCSNLHNISAIAVDFCGKQNCYDKVNLKEYEIIITSELPPKYILCVSKFINKTPVQIYKAIKEHFSICNKVNFYNMLKLCKYLYDKNITFQVLPEIPLLPKFSKCFPKHSDNYEWVLKKYL